MKLFKRRFKWTFDIATWHFGSISVNEFVIQERIFPYRARVDLKDAVEDLLTKVKVVYACGIEQCSYQGSKLSRKRPTRGRPGADPLQKRERG